MTVVANVTVDGVNTIVTRLNAIGGGMSSRVGQALRECGQIFVREAAGNAPVDTGYLRDNIRVIDADNDSITIEAQAEYSGFQEYGTRYMSAQPFMQPAIRTTAVQMGRIIGRAVSGTR